MAQEAPFVRPSWRKTPCCLPPARTAFARAPSPERAFPDLCPPRNRHGRAARRRTETGTSGEARGKANGHPRHSSRWLKKQTGCMSNGHRDTSQGSTRPKERFFLTIRPTRTHPVTSPKKRQVQPGTVSGGHTRVSMGKFITH